MAKQQQIPPQNKSRIIYNKMNNMTVSQIRKVCKKYKIRNYSINLDRSINVNGNVYLDVKLLHKLPVTFNTVSGNFRCYGTNLTSLKGGPKHVGGNFYFTSLCGMAKLNSLDGAPSDVGGDFDCSFNKLSSLVGGPTKVGGNYFCYYNVLTSLVGSPETIGDGFYCSGNVFTSLHGGPKYIGGDFNCKDSNVLTSLLGYPETIGGKMKADPGIKKIYKRTQRIKAILES
jgi:hypothetical protein